MNELLSGGATGITIVTIWKGVEALTAYLNSRKNGNGKHNGKCVEHSMICIDIATIKERQTAIVEDVKEIKNDVKEIFRSLRGHI